MKMNIIYIYVNMNINTHIYIYMNMNITLYIVARPLAAFPCAQGLVEAVGIRRARRVRGVEEAVHVRVEPVVASGALIPVANGLEIAI